MARPTMVSAEGLFFAGLVFLATSVTTSHGMSGRDFVVGFPSNWYSNVLRLTSQSTTTAYIKSTYYNYTKTVNLTAGQPTEVTISSQFQFTDGEMIACKGVRVTADHNIVLTTQVYIHEGYLALPTQQLGYNYIVASYRPRGSGSFFSIIGITNGTTVSVKLNFPNQGSSSEIHISFQDRSYYNGQTMNHIIDALQVMKIRNYYYHDMTGTYVSANKPIVVISGYERRNQEFVELLPPDNRWGRNFFLGPLTDCRSGYDYQIVAGRSGQYTAVVTSAAQVNTFSLSAFQSMRVSAVHPFQYHINCSQPCLVVQYCKGSVDGRNIGFMSLVQPVEQGAPQLLLTTPYNQRLTQYVSIVANISDVSDVMVEPDHGALHWTRVLNTTFSHATVMVGVKGLYRVYHRDPEARIVGVVYGFAKMSNWESYGFPAGWGRDRPDTPAITTHPSSQNVIEGDSVQLTCQASGQPAPPSYEWRKNNQPLDPAADARISTADGGSRLMITGVLRGDQANYTCVANNSVGSATSSAAFLTVNYAPALITTHPPSQTATEGDKVNLTCLANGQPAPSSYEWRKNNQPLDPAADARISTADGGSTLMITGVLRGDQANYTCVANNSVGSATSSAALLTVNSLTISVLFARELFVALHLTFSQTGIVFSAPW